MTLRWHLDRKKMTGAPHVVSLSPHLPFSLSLISLSYLGVQEQTDGRRPAIPAKRRRGRGQRRRRLIHLPAPPHLGLCLLSAVVELGLRLKQLADAAVAVGHGAAHEGALVDELGVELVAGRRS